MFAIGALSKITGCNIETIRYYERIALIPKPARRGRYRVYGLEDTDRLRFVRRARELGFSIEEVRTLLRIALTQSASCEQARMLAAAHLADVRTKIADLDKMEAVLSATVAACERDHDDGCPVITALSDS